MARNTRATSTDTPARTPRYLSPKGLADWFDVPLRTVRRWQTEGYGPKPIRLNRLLRYPMSEVKKFETDPEAYQCKREMEIDLS